MPSSRLELDAGTMGDARQPGLKTVASMASSRGLMSWGSAAPADAHRPGCWPPPEATGWDCTIRRRMRYGERSTDWDCTRGSNAVASLRF
jgi:hypothetical protein